MHIRYLKNSISLCLLAGWIGLLLGFGAACYAQDPCRAYDPTILQESGVLELPSPSAQVPVRIQWLVNNTPIPGATEARFTPTANGSYRAVLEMESEEFNFQISAIEALHPAAGVQIFPNPSAGQYTIQVVGQPDLPIQALVYNPLGKLVLNLTLPASAAGEYTLDAQSLPEGMYYVRILLAKSQSTHKVFIQR